jgi:hypothetical protein
MVRRRHGLAMGGECLILRRATICRIPVPIIDTGTLGHGPEKLR